MKPELISQAWIKQWARVLGAVVPLAAVVGCPMMPDGGGMEKAEPTATALFESIAVTDSFRQWAQFPDAQGTLDSNLPHGPMSRVYINDVVADALGAMSGTLPNDSIIVKENIGEDPSVTEAALTVMWKVPGFDPDNNDWFWANMSLDGTVVAEGAVEGCIACHGRARGNDFVFLQQLP